MTAEGKNAELCKAWDLFGHTAQQVLSATAARMAVQENHHWSPEIVADRALAIADAVALAMLRRGLK